jgi:inositol transport system substrate-binding protein
MKQHLLLIAFTCLFLGCNSSKKEEKNQVVIGATMLSMQTEFIVNISDEMQKKADEMGVKLILVDAEHSSLKQMEQVESFIAQKVDAIVINPCEVEASSPAVARAIAAKVPIVGVNSATTIAPNSFVGSDDVEAARIAMKYIAEKLGGKGNIVMISGFMGQSAQVNREKGANEILKANPNLKLLAAQPADWDRAKGLDLMQNWIQSYGTKINAVFAQNDEMALGAVKALQAAGMKDKVIVVGIDAIQDAIQAVKKGEMDATVFQNSKQQGAGAIEVAIKMAKKQAYDKQIMIPFQLVTKENLSEFLK